MNLSRLWFVSLVFLVLTAGCAGKQGPQGLAGANGGNNAPAINALIANPPMVQPGGVSTITCTAIDPHGSALKYTWTVGAGSITDTGNIATWTAPSQNSVVTTITVLVSDANGGSTNGAIMVATEPSIPGTGSLQGNVTAFGETDSSGIAVSLLGTDISTITNASGDFTLTNVPVGTYTIQGSLSPYQPKTRNNIIVTGNGNYNVYPFTLKLGQLLNPGGGNIQITSDQTTIVFISNGNLYSQPSNGSAPPILLDTNVEQFQITPDSSRVIYVNGSYNLSSTTIASSAPVLLDTNVNTFQLTPDGSRVVYINRSNQLYSSPVTSSAPLLLDSSANICAFCGASFQVTPDGSRVVYVKMNGSDQLYSTTISSSAPILLDSNVNVNCPIQITPNSSRVLYVNWSGSLSSTTISSSAPVLLAAYVSSCSLQMTPDSSKVVYVNGSDQLYSTTISSSAPVLLDTNVCPVLIQYNGGCLQLTPDGSRVVYVKMNGSDQLYSTTISSSAPILLDTNVSTFLVTPDSSNVVYFTGGGGLYSTHISSSAPVLLDAGAVNNLSAVNNFKITPDSKHVLYYNYSGNLYFRVIDGSTQAHGVDDYTSSFLPAVSSDGSFFVYNRSTSYYPQSLDNGMFRVDFPAGW